MIERANRAGVTGFVLGGTCPADWDRQLALESRYRGQVLPCFGFHPWWAAKASSEELDSSLRILAEKLPLARGLGELGLDFGRSQLEVSRPMQIQAFERQLELGRSTGHPLVLHIVRAHREAVSGLKQFGVPARGGLVHSFSASFGEAKPYLDLGLCISVGTAAADPKRLALHEALRRIPSERLVLETDSPDQPLAAWSGRLSEPAALIEVAKAVGEIRGESPALILERSRSNLQRVFSLE